MITLEVHKKPMQLIEGVEAYGGFDICGTDWDWGAYFECPLSLDECADYYERVMYIFGCNIYLEKYVKDWYSWTTIEEFIKNHIGIFEKFIEATFREEYIPNWETFDLDSEEFYELFLDQMMESILNGNFAEEEYKILYDLFMEEN